MINDETQEVDLEISTEEAEEGTQEDTQEEEQGLEYWKAEALKNKAILDRNKNKEKEVKQPKQSDEFGYDVKAYLKSSGINASEFKFVKQELTESGLDLDALLENEYFQSKLEKSRELVATAEAVPKGKRGNGVAIDSVDYWIAKPFDEVPMELRTKVLNARLEKDESGGKFYNS